jgi:hypothetical protein
VPITRRSRRIVIGVTAAGAIAATGIGLAAAQPTSTTHTLTFNAIQISVHQVGSTKFIAVAKDKRDGTFIGNDVVLGVFDVTTQTFRFHVAAALKGGFIYGQGHGNSTGAITGTVTGGTGVYRSISGTLRGTPVSSTSERVTITYTT